jgi:hypothetical protein
VSLNPKIEEYPIQAAVRWKHVHVVEYFLKNVDFEPPVLKKCLKEAPNSQIKEMVNAYIKKKYPNERGCFSIFGGFFG